MIVREAATGLSGDLVDQDTFRRAGLAGLQIGGITIERRAVGADDLVVVAEIEKNMGMVERRIGADAHELLRTDLNNGNAGIVMEVRNDMVRHQVHLRLAPAADNTGMKFCHFKAASP